MEWQVGQWVEAFDRYGTIARTSGDVVAVKCWDGQIFAMRSDEPTLKPFTWQAGKTYKTTLEGVTATINSIDDGGKLWGNDSREDETCDEWIWDGNTGRLNDVGCEGVPHLLPFLADEPSEPDPTLTERYTVEQREGRWAVVDLQEDRGTPCADHETAVQVLECVKAGQVISGWVRSDHPGDPIEPQQHDPINPHHYRDHPSGVECIQVTEHMGYCVGNAIKYLWRAGKKGPEIEDLKKAAWYINREIERLAKGGA